jgi:hypothetical protein
MVKNTERTRMRSAMGKALKGIQVTLGMVQNYSQEDRRKESWDRL